MSKRAGIPNKRSQETKQKLDLLGVDPIDRLARLSMVANAVGDREMEYKCLTTLAKYYAPQLKAVEVSVDAQATMAETPIQAARAFKEMIEEQHKTIDIVPVHVVNDDGQDITQE